MPAKEKNRPPLHLRIVCVGSVDVNPPGTCDADLQVPFEMLNDDEAMTALFDEKSWFMSVMTPPGQGRHVPIVLAPLCEKCAEILHHPGVLMEMKKIREERRKKRRVS